MPGRKSFFLPSPCFPFLSKAHGGIAGAVFFDAVGNLTGLFQDALPQGKLEPADGVGEGFFHAVFVCLQESLFPAVQQEDGAVGVIVGDEILRGELSAAAAPQDNTINEGAEFFEQVEG